MKKNIFRVGSLIVVVLSLGLIGGLFVSCEKNKKQSEEIVLEYWSWDPELRERNQEVISKFEEENPGVTVNMTVMEPKEYWVKMKVAASQKDLPDVFNISSGYLEEWSSNGLLYDISSKVDNELLSDFYNSLIEGAKAISKQESSYYALPYAQVVTTLYFNKDMFDAAGISYPDETWTWDDFLDAARKLTIDKDADGKTDQWGFWFYGRYAHIEPWIYSNDGNLIDRENNTFAPDANAKEALAFLTNLVLTEKVAPPKKIMDAFKPNAVFPQGQAAMWIDGSWNIDNNRTVIGDSFQWGIASIPKGPNGTGEYIYGWPDSIGIAPNTDNFDMAWKFAKYVAGEGLSMDMYLAGKIPSYKKLTESDDFLQKEQQPNNMEMLRDTLGGKMKTSFTLGWGEWRGYGASEALGFNGILDAILEGEMTYKEGMALADTNINKVLSRYYNK